MPSILLVAAVLPVFAAKNAPACPKPVVSTSRISPVVLLIAVAVIVMSLVPSVPPSCEPVIAKLSSLV